MFEQGRIEDVVGTMWGPSPRPVGTDEHRAATRMMHDAGVGWGSIARKYNADRLPTPSGRPDARWHGPSVKQYAQPEWNNARMRRYRDRTRGRVGGRRARRL